MNVTTIVLAGGAPDDVAAVQPGAINKAFVRIGGVPLVARTLRALRAAPSVGRIICVAPASAHDSPALELADERRDDGTRISDSLWNGLRGLPPDDPVFVSASDLPILSTQCIEAFLRDARSAEAEVAYAILERSTHMRDYPHIPHTWARMRDGTYCGGGFITLRPRAWPLLARFIERLGAARKNPLHLASLFGWDVLLRYAVRRLSVAQAEARASSILGAHVRAVISTHPEMAVNVDRASDIALAEALVSSKATTSA